MNKKSKIGLGIKIVLGFKVKYLIWGEEEVGKMCVEAVYNKFSLIRCSSSKTNGYSKQ